MDLTSNPTKALLAVAHYVAKAQSKKHQESNEIPNINHSIDLALFQTKVGYLYLIGILARFFVNGIKEKSLTYEEITKEFSPVLAKEVEAQVRHPIILSSDPEIQTVANDDTILLLWALVFAANKHQAQRRKDQNQSAYITHPIHVAYLLSQAGVTDNKALVGALLHDTVEDTDTNYTEIGKSFGLSVANIVAEVSDDKSLDKVQRKKLQIEHAKHASQEAKLIKLGDKLSNLSDLLANPPKKWSPIEIKGYAIWAYHVVAQLRGTNEQLEAQLDEVFKGFGIDSSQMDDATRTQLLTEYYGNIKDSD